MRCGPWLAIIVALFLTGMGAGIVGFAYGSRSREAELSAAKAHVQSLKRQLLQAGIAPARGELP